MAGGGGGGGGGGLGGGGEGGARIVCLLLGLGQLVAVVPGLGARGSTSGGVKHVLL